MSIGRDHRKGKKMNALSPKAEPGGGDSQGTAGEGMEGIWRSSQLSRFGCHQSLYL